jgi:signal transduction histidine kinase
MSQYHTKNLCHFRFLHFPKFTLFYFILAFSMFLLLPFGNFGQCPDDGISRISRKVDQLNIPLCSEILADATFKITFDSLHQHPERYHFKSLRGNVQIEEPMGATYWLRFKIRNEDSLPLFRLLHLYRKEIEYAQLFVIDEAGQIDTSVMIGSAIPFEKNPYSTLSILFPINFSPQKTYTLYLYLDYRDMPLATHAQMSVANILNAAQIQKASFFTGLALSYALIALIMFSFNRKPVYFSYFLYTFAGACYLASSCNMGYAYIWSNWKIFSSISDDVLGGVALIGFQLMTIFFFETPQYFKILDKLLKGIIGLTIAFIVVGLFRKILPFGTYYQVMQIWMPANLFIIPIVLTITVKSYLKFRRKEALLFLLGFASLLATIITVVLTELGFLRFQYWAHSFLPNFTVFFEFSIMFIVLIYRLRDEWTSKKIKELELQQNLSEQRQRISRDLHDDVGSTLNSISVFSEIAKQQLQKSNPESLPLLDRIGDASRELVSTINDIVWAINPQNDKFESIALKMRLFAADLMMPKDVDLDFQADTSLNSVNLSLEQRKQFYLIFKEAINNVYKYAECSTLKVHLEWCETEICMTIIDNGNGFDTVHPKQGNGLKSMAERAKILRGVLEINSELEKGTTIKLRFPIQ